MYPKRKSLESIRSRGPQLIQREAVRRQKIRGLLISRFRLQLGSVKPELDAAIRSEVDSIMRQKSLYQAQMRLAEKRLRSLSRSGEKLTAQAVNQSCCVHAASEDYANSSGIKANPCNVSMTLDTPGEKRGLSLPAIRPRSKLDSPDKNLWAKIMEFDLQQFKQERDREQQTELEKRLKIRLELERQVRDKAKAHEAERRAQLEFDRKMLSRDKLLAEQESKRTMEARGKLLKEKSIRDQQLKGTAANTQSG